MYSVYVFSSNDAAENNLGRKNPEHKERVMEAMTLQPTMKVGDRVYITSLFPGLGTISGITISDSDVVFYDVRPDGYLGLSTFFANQLVLLICECGVKFSREGGMHSDYCPLAKEAS